MSTVAFAKLVTAAFLAFSAIAIPGVVHAAACTVTLPSTDPDGSLADATHCDVATPASHGTADTLSALNAEDPGALGLTWTFIDRDPGSEAGQIEAAFNITTVADAEGDLSSGTWLIDRGAISSSFDTFVVTMKDGNPLNDDFLWFLIDTSASANVCSASQAAAGWDLCGTWNMYGTLSGPPGAQVPNAKSISYMDLFAADNPGGGTGGLPEPGSIALLAMVLSGIGILSRRRR